MYCQFVLFWVRGMRLPYVQHLAMKIESLLSHHLQLLLYNLNKPIVLIPPSGIGLVQVVAVPIAGQA